MSGTPVAYPPSRMVERVSRPLRPFVYAPRHGRHPAPPVALLLSPLTPACLLPAPRADAPAFELLAAGIAAGLVFSALTDTCGMALALGRLPFNRRR